MADLRCTSTECGSVDGRTLCRHEIADDGTIVCRSGKHAPYPPPRSTPGTVSGKSEPGTTIDDLELMLCQWMAAEFTMTAIAMEAQHTVAEAQRALAWMRRTK